MMSVVKDVTATLAAERPALTAQDRCDRCGAQAAVRVILSSGGELLFCRHHAREHSDRLREIAVHIDEETNPAKNTPAGPTT